MSVRGWIALWAGLLAVLALLTLVFKPGVLPPLLLGGAALGTVTLAVAGGRLPVREPGSPLPATTAAFGIALTVAGAEFGTWMLAIGAGLLVGSLGALAAERVAR